MDKNKIWKVVLAELEIDTDVSHFKTIFKHSTAIEYKDNIFDISVPSEYTKKLVEDKYQDKVLSIVNRLTSTQNILRINVKELEDTRQKTYRDFSDTPMFEKLEQPAYVKSEGLLPQFTFDKYIVGSHNRLAHAVALAIAENSGKVYNPYFLYSQVGLGKTHLVQAIGNQIHFRFPEKKIVYVSGEDFVNQLVEAIRGTNNKGREFREKYRKVDVLIIDDVHFLAGKEATQEEFFHTFNSLHMANKQIILTSDRPPKDIKNLEDRLTSRFSAGMMADIQVPNFETRIAILQSKNEQMAVDAGPDVVNKIAEIIDTNIRELEGAFLQVVTAGRSRGQVLSVSFVEEVLKGIKNTRTTTSVNDIVKAVSNYYDVKIADIKGQRRQKHISQARQICMYLMREVTNTPFETIGDILGGRDHSTVMHGVNKVSLESVENSMLKTDLKNIEKNLQVVD